MEPPKTSKRKLTAHYSSIFLFDKTALTSLKGLELASCNPFTIENEEKVEEAPVDSKQQDVRTISTVSDSMFCNCCQADFADRDEQVLHYKCDWHRYNLHLHLRGLKSISEEEFENIAGEVSSISGSDEESNDENNRLNKDLQESVESSASPEKTESVPQERKFHKVFFKNEEGELISLYRCLLHHKKNPFSGSSELCTAALQAVFKRKWIILMVSAGHFAGAVLNGEEIVEHKTFHRYTVRAKRGTAQSSRDSQGNAPKSAGSALRRYNEAALVQDVQELMSNWSNHLKSCELIFVHIPVANRGMFYAGKHPVLRKDDDRIRIIPFPTRRPTFSEVKRVHQMLASVECYGQEADARDFIPMSPQRMFNKESGKLEIYQRTHSPKPVKSIIKNLHKIEKEKSDDSLDTSIQAVSSESESPEDSENLIEVVESINLSNSLKEFDSSLNKKRRKKKVKKAQEQCEGSYDKQIIDEKERHLRNSIFTACKLGHVESLQKVINQIKPVSLCGDETTESEISDVHHLSSSVGETVDPNQGICTHTNVSEISPDSLNTNISSEDQGQQSESNSVDQSLYPNHDSQSKKGTLPRILNCPIGENGNTFLHLASMEGHPDIVGLLMEEGADPTIRNQGGKLPYNLGNVEVRNAFRRFMAHFPDKYDYTKAQIPFPLTSEMEEQKRQKLAKKRAEKKKAANERNKAKKAAEKLIQTEEEEKARFLALSDREKRALAAEKRIVQHHLEQGTSKPVLSRCWQCGIDITGKVPFEYSDFKFCTTQCLRGHRRKQKS